MSVLLVDQLRLMARHVPDAIAYRTVDGEHITFAAWEAESNRLARGLVGRGVAKGDRVAVYLDSVNGEQCSDNVALLRGLLRSIGIDGTQKYYWGGNPSTKAAHFFIRPGGSDTARRADGAKQVGGVMAVVAHHQWTRTDRRPDIGVCSLLPYSGLILT